MYYFLVNWSSVEESGINYKLKTFILTLKSEIHNFILLKPSYRGSRLINLGFLIQGDLIRAFNFRLYRLERLHYFSSCTKF